MVIRYFAELGARRGYLQSKVPSWVPQTRRTVISSTQLRDHTAPVVASWASAIFETKAPSFGRIPSLTPFEYFLFSSAAEERVAEKGNHRALALSKHWRDRGGSILEHVAEPPWLGSVLVRPRFPPAEWLTATCDDICLASLRPQPKMTGDDKHPGAPREAMQQCRAANIELIDLGLLSILERPRPGGGQPPCLATFARNIKGYKACSPRPPDGSFCSQIIRSSSSSSVSFVDPFCIPFFGPGVPNIHFHPSGIIFQTLLPP